MNKIQIALLLSLFCTLAMSYSFDNTEPEFFVSCTAQLTAYSDYAKTAISATQSQISKVFSCGSKYQTTTSRNICETTNSLATLDPSVQKYYSDCLIPKFDRDNSSCTHKSSCETQNDKCTTCTESSTCSSFKNSGTPFNIDFLAAIVTPGCAARAASCPATMSPILLSTCEKYQSDTCAQTWLKAHPTDPCYDSTICAMSSTVLSVSILAVIAFLVF